jgi:chromosome segregation ATPase
MPFSVHAQQESSQTTVERELRMLGDRTAEVIRLLEELVAQRAEDQRLRRIQVAVLALQLRSTAITSIEERIRTLEDRAASANQRVAQLEAEIERIDKRMMDASMRKAEGRKRLEDSKSQAETQLEIATQRAWSYESQILDLQNDLNDKQQNMEALEGIVMEWLGDL